MDDYNDLGSVLLGGGLYAVSDTFDPFEPRPRHEGRPASVDDDHDDGDIDSDIIDNFPDDQFRPRYSGREGVREYDGGGVQSSSGYQPDDDQPLPWSGGTKGIVTGSTERAEREAARAGDSNVRRTAERHGGGTESGGQRPGKVNSPGVDSSIAAAQERIRSDLRGSTGSDTGRMDPGRSIAVQKFREAGLATNPTTLQRDAPVLVPEFLSTEFHAVVAGLKANAGGDWILTLKVDRDERQNIYSLDDAFGQSLVVHIQRRRFTNRDTA